MLLVMSLMFINVFIMKLQRLKRISDIREDILDNFMKSFAPERKLVVTFGFFDISPDTLIKLILS